MNDELTTRLSRQLHEQVDDWHSAPVTLEGVRGRARSIRRRRAALTTGVAAAAVLAVMTPLALTMGDTGAQRPGPAENPTGVVEQQASEIGVPYLEGRRLVLPDGTRRDLQQRYTGGAVVGDTVFGLRNDDSGFLVLDELDADGGVIDSVVTETGITRNAEGSAIAYVTDGELVVRGEDGHTVIGEFGPVVPVRLLGGPDCTDGQSDCIVYFNDETGGAPEVATSFGSHNEVPGNPMAVVDVAEDGRISMITDVTDLPEPGSCSAVHDPSSGQEVHSSCDYTFGHFSPDGALLSATHSYQDGFGDGWHAILDADTGKELGRYESGTGGITQSVWEDSSHLLITSWEDGEWKVTRLASDGSTEVVLGPTPGGDFKPSYVVLGRAF